MSPILQNLKGRSVLDNIFFENDPTDVRAEKDATKQKVIYFQEIGQKCKVLIKIGFIPLSLSRLQHFFKTLYKGKSFAVRRVREG